MNWLKAIRPRTLPLALSSIGMGSFLAAHNGYFDGLIFGLCCLTTLMLQVLSNLANDYGDALRGVDHAGRKGPERTVQAGKIKAHQMERAIVLMTFLSLACGLLLLGLALGTDLQTGVVFFILGLLCIVASLTYTLGKRPYGYAGFGDISVFIFFGLVGVGGSFYLMAQIVDWTVLLPAISCGLFSVAVLNINNIRDLESDKVAGKNSLAVQWGRPFALRYHVALLTLGFLATLAYTILNYESSYQFLFVGALPFLIANGRAVCTKKDNIDPWLRQMALTTLLFVVLFGVGILLNGL